MRSLGHRVVDLIVDHLTTLREQPAGREARRAELEPLLREPPPEEGRDPAEVLARIERDVLSWMGRVHHPRFFAFVPSPSNYVGVLADALATAHNVFAGTWLESSGPAMLEIVTLEWLREWCGLPDGAGGLFVSGGSEANLHALAAARHVALADRLEGTVTYASDQTHSAVDRALRVLGFAPEQLRRIPSDEQFRLPVEPLRAAIADDRAHGLRPFCVIANAGTVNTGAVDPFPALADLCAGEGLWLHADAAYGGATVLCEAGRRALAGIERVDSLALDPHKWLFQPYEIGCVLVRDRRWLHRTFHILPEYLRDVERGEGEVNFADYGVQLTRSFRALKLWMTLQVFGMRAFRVAVARGIANAERAEAMLRERPFWEVVTPATLGIVTFRWRPGGSDGSAITAWGTPVSGDGHDDLAERVNARIAAASLADGFTLVSSTVLRGRTVVRLCPINPRTTEDDIRDSLERLETLAARLADPLR
jgi:glutamate/tyrosine decarboxylase-like PLP-dependent enzyme